MTKRPSKNSIGTSADACLMIDIQPVFARTNAGTLQRLKQAVPLIRKQMPLIWLASDDRQSEAVRSGSRRFRDVFNHLSGNYAPVFKPARRDWFLAKEDSDGFSNPHLPELLDELGVKNLYMTGFIASGCVYATALSAASNGFSTRIIRELVADEHDTIDPDGLKTGRGIQLSHLKDVLNPSP